MNTDFYIFFGICFLCYVIRTTFNILNYKKHPVAENRIVVIFVFISMGVLWFSWFAMCFSDPIKMDVPTWLTYLGLLFFLLGVFLFIISHRKLKGFEGKDELVTTGIYSKIRNPMYVGFIIWLVGFPIFTHGFLTLTSSLIWVAFILYWKTLEETELENKYEEYAVYKKMTWF